MKNYDYEKIVSKYGKYRKHINVLNTLIANIFYIAYPILIFILLINKDKNIYKMILIPGISFIIVSIVRKLINKPRPYESYNIDSIIKKDTKGKSMPSRHIFSSSIIGMCFLQYNLILGILFLILSSVLAWIRVIGGVHYKEDVMVGYVIGIICGILLYIL